MGTTKVITTVKKSDILDLTKNNDTVDKDKLTDILIDIFDRLDKLEKKAIS